MLLAIKNMDFSLLFVAIIIIVFTLLLVFLSIKVRRRGGSMVTTMLGATYELHGEDRKRAIETIVEKAADQKTEEQSSGDPKEKCNSSQSEK